ncbi:hypothetical protein BDP27DRAFT_1438276 [Rhodocollybia butyracea]|uniref:Uncharacterized protein n=1 Tax=Rhodocollybia butyracea TaxID=206335 RepID=A0A9P5P4M3_9AGAR|nr:hypothetical protein BDP27DRAFT_1438276 [Rhodocollybia butyracea]
MPAYSLPSPSTIAFSSTSIASTTQSMEVDRTNSQSPEIPRTLYNVISHARVEALERALAGENYQEIKANFAEIACAAILPAFREFRTEQNHRELDYDDMKYRIQQIYSALENSFDFICDGLNGSHAAASSASTSPVRAPSSAAPSSAFASPARLPAPVSGPAARKRRTQKPAQQPTVPLSLPPIVPGTQFVMPDFAPRPFVPESNNTPAFVFLGINKTSGVFCTFAEAEAIAPPRFRDRLLKSFMNYEAAMSHYKECVTTGVIAMLKEDETPNTVYIVTQGFEPGVFQKCQHVLSQGLNYRSGEVTWSKGTLGQASAIFQGWRDLGRVKVLLWKRPFET